MSRFGDINDCMLIFGFNLLASCCRVSLIYDTLFSSILFLFSWDLVPETFELTVRELED